MKRPLGGGLLLLVLMVVPGTARAATPTPPPPKLTGSGTVEGTLAAGSLLTVRLRVSHSQGWQHIQEIDVDLDLRGSPLEQLQFAPSASSLAILGDGPPASLGQSGHVEGDYFDVNPAKVTLTAQGNLLRVTLPIRLRTAPPAGARLEFNAKAVPLAETGLKALTPPVKSKSGFSWGTLGVAIAVALFAGAFFGNVFGGRRRPTTGPSVYGAVQRRLEQEKAGSSK